MPLRCERFFFELLARATNSLLWPSSRTARADGLTQAPEVVRAAMATLKPFGSTALYDAVLTALPMMNTRTKQRASVLIISDGADTASEAALREVRAALVRSDAFVYAIAVDPPAKRAINETVNVAALNELTGGSGGKYRVVNQTADLVTATARIAEELNSQYVLGYYSPCRSTAVSQYPRARHQSRVSCARAARLHRDAADETPGLRTG